MQRSSYLDLFLSESREHIAAINRLLLSLERDPDDRTPVEELFRSLHTLKGMSAAMGCQHSARLAHALEHLLEQIRRGTLAVDAEITEALFQGVDALERAIGEEARGAAPEGAQPVLELLGSLAGEAAYEAPAPGDPAPEQAPRDGDAAGSGRPLRVRVVIQASASLPAARAMLVLRRARELGEVSAVEPSEAHLTGSDFAGSLAFRLRTEHELDEARAALLAAGEVAHLELEEEAAPAAADPSAAEEASGTGRAGGPLVRIRQQRLDALVNQVGELVIARDRLRGLVRSRNDEELEEAADELAALIGELRDEVMGVRMVAVGEVFDRFPRLARDAARSLGKRVRFSMSGQDVELDRSVVDELGDLLVHLLRNAIDHGIEPPEQRAAAGKPETGEVRVVAERGQGQVTVRVEDDGRGVDRDRVRRSAAAHGWLVEGRELSGDDVFRLITRPGFTTAEQVTDVSGRGVGLDVVRTRAHALGGSLEVESEPGRGSVFTLRLPLSLAIVRALQVEVGGESYSLPVSAVVEVAETDDAPGAEAGAPDGALWLRGSPVPLVRLREVLGLAGGAPVRHAPVAVVEGADGWVGLVVDALLGQHEAVLKPFDPAVGTRPFFSGATVLGSGQPSLILDVPRLCAWLEQHPEHGGPDRVGLRPTTMTETLC